MGLMAKFGRSAFCWPRLVTGLLLALLTGGVSDRQRLSEAGAIARVNDRHIDREQNSHPHIKPFWPINRKHQPKPTSALSSTA